MSSIAVVPGSFDPVTLGHLDVIGRAAALFDQVHVVVGQNPDKLAMLPVEDRIDLLRAATAERGIERVTVDRLEGGLLVEYCKRVGATVLVKGLRSQADLAYETPMAIVNRDLAGVETVFLLPEPGRAHVSSSLVRQVAMLGGDVAHYVPDVVTKFLAERSR